MTDDVVLLRRYAEEKSEAAFTELVHRHLNLVYSAALRRLGGDAHAAADVAQQVFAALARDAARLARHTVLTAWLYTATRHAAIDHIRAEQRRANREQEATAMQNLFTSSGLDNEWEKLRPVLDGVMDELGDTDRAAVLLRFFEQRPFAEIGAALNLTEDAARMRIERALGKLQARLAHRGIHSTSAALGIVLANQAMAASAPATLAANVTSAALTSAAAGVTGPGSVIFGFMSKTKIVVTLAAVIAAVGLGSALYESDRASEAESTAATLRLQHDRLQAQLSKFETIARESEQRASALEIDAAKARTGKREARSAAESGAAAGSSSSAVNFGLDILAHPEYVRLSVAKFRTDVGLRYAPLYKMLGLSSEQIAAFEANRAKHQQSVQDVTSAAVAKGVSTSNPGVVELAKDSVAGAEKDLRGMLGENGYEKYVQYYRALSGGALEVVTSLAGGIYDSERPLTSQQGDRLIEAVMNHTLSVPAIPGSKTMRSETDWAAVTKQAQVVLTPSQMAVFEAVVGAKKLQQELAALGAKIRATAVAKPGGG